MLQIPKGLGKNTVFVDFGFRLAATLLEPLLGPFPRPFPEPLPAAMPSTSSEIVVAAPKGVEQADWFGELQRDKWRRETSEEG